MVPEYDVAIIGGGIVGLTTAMALTERAPGPKVAVLEKEPQVASHQSGRNSGVIHSGLYYRPGSLRARLCREGIVRLVRFCDERGVAYTRDGKVVVATSEAQLPALAELERRGRANGLRGVKRIGPGRLREIEPHAVCVEALHVPETGAVDFGDVCRAVAEVLRERDATISTSFRVENISVSRSHVAVEGSDRAITARVVVNCGGLYSDHLARAAGLDPEVRIVAFRGEYYDITGPSADLVRSSIYPVPDPKLPFLGLHLTRSADGTVHAGPNAVPTLAREGYRWRTVRPAELLQSLTYPGFLRLAGRHWRSGIAEIIRSASRRLFVRSARELVPELDPGDLSRGRSGVRALALTRSGELHDDFLIEVGPRSVHVLNAPSPAATSSLAIGAHVADRVRQVVDLG
ncbi:L-2-hydroxyglutarate oxidase [Candidatus Spongiisocius sp.]|uniref:L-2-hydroxyglutarate oxidase n=1 Tax=Candidatus Spongiisocius sp. TaxID=3101273 RepID=UPI003B5A70D9